MNTKNFFRSIVLSLLAVIFISGTVQAASVPNLILGSATAGTDAVQVTVYGADPNTSVQLFHPTASSYASTNIGTTNSSGYLLTTVNSTTFGITAQSPVYVMVNGQQSTTQNWPNFTSTGSLSLSQNNLVIQIGQSSTISAAVSAPLSLSSNSNSMVATVSINGNQIIVNAINSGTSNISICALGVGCANLVVTVQAANSSSPAAISFSQSSLNIVVGQSQPVTITGSGNYYVSNNSNPSAVSTSLNGSTLAVNAIASGNSSLSVCASSNNTTSCGMVNVIVSGTNSTTTSNTNSDNSIVFSPTNATLVVGQRQSVSILGSGTYFVSTNSNPASVTANINGSNVDLTGLAFGSSNVKICQMVGGCGNLYVYVSPTTSTAGSVTTTGTPAISSITVTSNNANGFIGTGSVLTFTFSTNQTVNIPSVNVAGNRLIASGSGNGPYTATYTVTGREGVPMPLEISFTNTAGTGGQAYLALGSLTNTNSNNSSGASSATIGTTFTQYLEVGSTGTQVTALQNLLTKLGIYSGPITGKFGAQTEAAVKKYQAKHNINQLGAVGPATRALLNQGI